MIKVKIIEGKGIENLIIEEGLEIIITEIKEIEDIVIEEAIMIEEDTKEEDTMREEDTMIEEITMREKDNLKEEIVEETLEIVLEVREITVKEDKAEEQMKEVIIEEDKKEELSKVEDLFQIMRKEST